MSRKAVAGRVPGCPPIPAVSLGRRKLVRRETLLSWIERNEQAAANDNLRRCMIISSHRQYGVPGNAHKEKFECANAGTKKEVKKQRGRWVAMWWVDGRRKSRVIGFVKDMTKSEAREAVNRIVTEDNAKREQNRVWRFGEFVSEIYFPYYSRKWKDSTRENNVNRVIGSSGGQRSVTVELSGLPARRAAGPARREGASRACRFPSSIICAGI